MPHSAPAHDGTHRPSAGGPAVLACTTLVLLTALLPWFFGGVLRETRQLTMIVGLGALVVAFAWSLRTQALALPAVPLWPLAGLLALGALQLVPFPPALHALVAPGSHAIWHPREAAAALVLGTTTWRPLSVDPQATREALAFAGLLGLLGLLAAPALASRRAAWRAGLVVAFSGTAVAVFGVVTRTAFGPLLYGHIAVPTINPYGPFVNKNHFAGYVAMTALLAAGVCLGLKEDARRRSSDGDWRHGPRAGSVLAVGACALAGALAVLVSLSRGGALGLVAGALTFGLVHVLATRARRGAERDRRLVGLFGLGAVGLVVVALFVLPAQSKARLGGVSLRDASLSFRLDTWTGTLRLATHSPLLGYGYGGFESAYLPYKTSLGDHQVEHPENQMLELLAEAGLLGLFLAFVTLRVLAGAATAGSRQRGEPFLRGFITGAAAGLCALLVQDLVDFNLHVPSNACVFTFLVAVVAAGRGSRLATLRVQAGLAAALVLVAVAAFGYRSAPPSLDTWRDGAQRAARLPEDRGLRLARTEAGLRAYLQERPTDPQAWLLLAWTRLLAGDRATANALLVHAGTLDPANPTVIEQVRTLTR